METEVRETEHKVKTIYELSEEIVSRLKGIRAGVYVIAFLLGVIIALLVK